MQKAKGMFFVILFCPVLTKALMQACAKATVNNIYYFFLGGLRCCCDKILLGVVRGWCKCNDLFMVRRVQETTFAKGKLVGRWVYIGNIESDHKSTTVTLLSYLYIVK